MLAQMDAGLIISVAGVIIVMNGGAVGLLWRQMSKNKDEFDKHRESVQYKDTCQEIVKRQDERHKEICSWFEKIDKRIDKVLNGR